MSFRYFNFSLSVTTVVAVLTAGISSLVAQSSSEGVLVNGVAAVVNDEVITYSQVREVVGARERMLRSMYRGQELIEQIQEARKSALDDLIDRQLILQEFKSMDMQIPDRVIDQRINALIVEEFGGDRQAFLRTLQAQGFTLTKFRELERDKIIVSAMRQRNVPRNILISPQKIEEYYRTNREKYSTPEQVKLRLIKIAKETGEEGSTPESQRAIAEEIRTKLTSGSDFERMAQMYSDDPTREEGGDWGWIDRNTLTSSLTNEIFKLKTGEISPVITLGDYYYILKVEARKNSTTRPLDEVRSEIEQTLLDEARSAQQRQWLDRLRKKAYIKTF